MCEFELRRTALDFSVTVHLRFLESENRTVESLIQTADVFLAYLKADAAGDQEAACAVRQKAEHTEACLFEQPR